MSEEELPKPSLRPPDLPKPNLAPPPAPPPAPTMADVPPPPPAADPAVHVNVRATAGTPHIDEDPNAEMLASANTRILAALLDFLVGLGLYLTVAWMLPDFLGTLVMIAYLLFRDSLPFLDGQSIGKKAMKLKALTTGGASLSGDWATGAIRNIPLVIPFFPIVELVVLLTREDGASHGKRLGDEWGKTKVIVVKEPPVEETPAEG